MGEPRRWEITGQAEGYPRVGGSFLNPVGHCETVHVREDQATEADLRAVATWMADGRKELVDLLMDDARELLALVFSEEASRV